MKKLCVLPVALGLLCAVASIAQADNVIGKLLQKAGFSAEQADKFALLLEPFVEDNLAFRLVDTAEKLVVASKLEAATLAVKQNPSDENLRAFGEAYKAHSELLRVERFLVRLKGLLGETEWAKLSPPKSTPKPSFDEARVRKILADITLGKVLGFYQRHHSPEDVEAVRRWQRGVRLTNAHRFARVIVPGKGWQVVYRGTQNSIKGMDVRLTTDAGDKSGSKSKTIDLGNGVSMKFALIPAGTFRMGSPASEGGRDGDEGPVHTVKLSKSFYMGVYEVTQAQYEAVMGKNPSGFKGAKNPVECVSWNDATSFCKKLSAKTGKSARLPTEAEWEYACRAGTTTPFHFGNTISTDQANYNVDYTYGSGRKGVYRQKTVPVGSFQPNSWGLYDMHGNVYEWCQDRYGKYPSGTVTDPSGPSSDSSRVFRGGSWFGNPRYCRSAHRDGSAPVGRYDYVGFRVVVVASSSALDRF